MSQTGEGFHDLKVDVEDLAVVKVQGEDFGVRSAAGPVDVLECQVLQRPGGGVSCEFAVVDFDFGVVEDVLFEKLAPFERVVHDPQDPQIFE